MAGETEHNTHKTDREGAVQDVPEQAGQGGYHHHFAG